MSETSGGASSWFKSDVGTALAERSVLAGAGTALGLAALGRAESLAWSVASARAAATDRLARWGVAGERADSLLASEVARRRTSASRG